MQELNVAVIIETKKKLRGIKNLEDYTMVLVEYYRMYDHAGE